MIAVLFVLLAQGIAPEPPASVSAVATQDRHIKGELAIRDGVFTWNLSHTVAGDGVCTRNGVILRLGADYVFGASEVVIPTATWTDPPTPEVIICDYLPMEGR